MAWFAKLCRQTGLMIHHLIKPDVQRREIKRDVEEKKAGPTVTLRRTTIEEIEVEGADPTSDDAQR